MFIFYPQNRLSVSEQNKCKGHSKSQITPIIGSKIIKQNKFIKLRFYNFVLNKNDFKANQIYDNRMMRIIYL